MGISRFLSSLHIQPTYSSVLQNILNNNLPNYFILKLGGSQPYLKFGNFDHNDWQYIKLDQKIPNRYESIGWINLLENGKLVVPLRHIRLIWRDTSNKEIRSEFAVTHCIHHGCRATLDTKSYYIYGPKTQLDVKILLK
jgi:hypothetical protein